jgi:hypothetical protein
MPASGGILVKFRRGEILVLLDKAMFIDMLEG